jgi:hypothetical protein
MELDPSQGTRASEPSLLDSLQDLVAFFLRYFELRLQLLGLESRETGFYLLFLALLFVSVLICFGGCINYVGGLPALPDDADLGLGMGMERPGTCSGAFDYQYRNCRNLQIQDREAIFPSDLVRGSKGS